MLSEYCIINTLCCPESLIWQFICLPGSLPLVMWECWTQPNVSVYICKLCTHNKWKNSHSRWSHHLCLSAFRWWILYCKHHRLHPKLVILFLGVHRCEALADKNSNVLTVPGEVSGGQCCSLTQPLCPVVLETTARVGSGRSSSARATAPALHSGFKLSLFLGRTQSCEHTFLSVKMGMNCVGIKSSTNFSREHRIYLS